MYDAVIIGSGPAGLSAALNLKLHNKDFMWFGSSDLSTKVEKSERIANYPGMPLIAGADLNESFRKQMADMDLELTDLKVTNIMPSDDHYMVLAGNDVYEARTVLFAIGSVPSKGIPGESEFLGRGVSYCATCDGFLYKDKTLAVICADARYEHEVEYLAGIAAKVHVFYTYKGATAKADNIEVLTHPIKEISGDLKANSITLGNGDSTPVDGVFVLKNAIAPATILSGLEMDGPHIVVNRQCETNYKGCYAAGDCTGRPYQITKAVGEGNIAAHAILEYISE